MLLPCHLCHRARGQLAAAQTCSVLCRGCSTARQHTRHSTPWFLTAGHFSQSTRLQQASSRCSPCLQHPSGGNRRRSAAGVLPAPVTASQQQLQPTSAASPVKRGGRQSIAGASPAMQQATPNVQLQRQHPPAVSHTEGLKGCKSCSRLLSSAQQASLGGPLELQCPPAASPPDCVLGSWSGPAPALFDSFLSRKSNKVGGADGRGPSRCLPFVPAACCCCW